MSTSESVPAGNANVSSKHNRTVRTMSQAVTNYLAGFDEYLPEEKLLLLLDKVRMMAIFGGASVVTNVEVGPDCQATCQAVGQAVCSINSLCADLWEELGGGESPECSQEEGEGEQDQSKAQGDCSQGAFFPSEIPEWKDGTHSEKEESCDFDSATEDM